MAAPRTNDTKEARTPKPLSISGATAARMLDLCYDSVRKLINRDVFTVIAPGGRAPGKRVFLYTDEVERYAETRDEAAVRELRAKKKRLAAAN